MKTQGLDILEKTPEGGEFAAGIYLYAISQKTLLKEELFLHNIWGTLPVRKYLSNTFYEGFHIATITVVLDEEIMLKDWNSFIEDCFKLLCEFGMKLCWAGGELCSFTPESLNPDEGGSSIYMGYIPKVGILRPEIMDDDLAELNDEAMQMLWEEYLRVKSNNFEN